MPDEPDFFAIDQNNLDSEWVNQPKLCRRYSERLADAQRDLEQAETKLEVVDADLDYRIRKKAGSGEKKPTEAAIKNQLIRSIEHIEAVAKIQKLRHRVGILRAAVKTVDHRKTALENLVDLRLADYFSEPRVRKTNREAEHQRSKDRARRPANDE
jgi:hypothetical protein